MRCSNTPTVAPNTTADSLPFGTRHGSHVVTFSSGRSLRIDLVMIRWQDLLQQRIELGTQILRRRQGLRPEPHWPPVSTRLLVAGALQFTTPFNCLSTKNIITGGVAASCTACSLPLLLGSAALLLEEEGELLGVHHAPGTAARSTWKRGPEVFQTVF